MDRFRFIQIKDCVTKNQETKDIVNEQLDSKNTFPTILPFVHESDIPNLIHWRQMCPLCLICCKTKSAV